MEPVEGCYHPRACGLGIVVRNESDSYPVLVHCVEKSREEGEALILHVLHRAAYTVVITLLGVVGTLAPAVKTYFNSSGGKFILSK